jgi:uncharacterized protein (TIGR02421 family)
VNNQKSIDFSAQLKDIAKDLSFLASPRYPLHDLKLLFPEHLSFINQLEDTSLPFSIDIGRKKKAIDEFLELLQKSDLFTGFRDLFQNRALDYMTIASMIENFGSSTFYQGCVGLYGSSRGKNDEIFFRFLSELPKTFEPDRSTKSLDEEEARSYLRDKLLETFPQSEFDVKASSSLLSDSSAGRRVLKLNPHKMHSTAQLDIFLVHEGWVHLGTSINGSHQKDNPWLSSWAPRTTRLQEGLAILTEMITNNMTLERWLKVRLRHQAVIMAEQGADISLVYEFLLDHQLEKADAFKLSLRVFRGVPLEGGMAFTKELLYLDGLVDLLLHLKKLNLELSSLWYGKMSFEEHRFLNEHKNTLKPTVTYFPRRLSDKDVTLKLDFLKNLVGIFFKDDSH